MNPVDATLDEVALRQLVWKPGPMRDTAIAICKSALADMSFAFWPDEVLLPELQAADRNCIGSAFRLLTKAGIIERLGSFRRSKAKGANGRTVFAYQLVSRAKAETFLRRNGATTIPKRQSEFRL